MVGGTGDLSYGGSGWPYRLPMPPFPFPYPPYPTLPYPPYPTFPYPGCALIFCGPGTWCRNGKCVPIGGGGGCTLEAKICPNGKSVGRTGPNCEFAPCDVGSGKCVCGSSCIMRGGGLGVCQTNGECAINVVAPNCGGNSCALIFCGPGTRCVNGKCVPSVGRCLVDSDCPDGQECVDTGLYRRCQIRSGSGGQRCFNWPYSMAADTSSSMVSASASARIYPGVGRCPSGQVCVNGVCQTCPALFCPMIYCPPELQEKQYSSNGCPLCPKCNFGGSGGRCSNWPYAVAADLNANSLTGAASIYPSNRCPPGQTCVNGVCQTTGCTGLYCLPCCPPIQFPWQPPCRDCGLRG
jgi:hypothetical protein